jgi:hypothetical protein
MKNIVKFEVLAVVFMKSSIFWDITPCGLLKVNQCFRETHRLHVQAVLATHFHAGFLLGILFGPEDGDDVDYIVLYARRRDSL